MAGKWIAAAAKRKVKRTALCTPSDPVLFKDRPALGEFMTELESAPNTPREPSVLMVCGSINGIRVGLKDDDAGGWLWREGATFLEALDAIEQALESGTAIWAVPGGRKGKK